MQEKEVRHSHEQRSLASVVFRVPWEGVTSIRPSCQIRVRVGVDVAIRRKDSVCQQRSCEITGKNMGILLDIVCGRSTSWIASNAVRDIISLVYAYIVNVHAHGEREVFEVLLLERC